ncbi:MAG: nucleotide sugar dehydrogenase [Nitrospirae bacterium]|nr:nucleotide sugar dehydrogenase [Nitrospirota bacterium]
MNRPAEKLEQRNVDICIVGGLGRVGLPLGISFARAGMNVMLYDIDREAAGVVASGKMPFQDTGAEEALREVLGKRLFLSSEKSCIGASRFVIIVIGTPVDEHLNPRLIAFKQLFSEISEYLRDEQHVILRSTIFPGTTEWLYQYLRSKSRRTRVSFCPERIAEGKAMTELVSLPQIVSSCDADGLQEVSTLFSVLTRDIVVLQPKEAELAKLFTNASRYIQFAISNQFYQIALHHGIDFYRVHEAMVHNYPRISGFAPAGLTAGPCLFKDTMQLAAFSNNTFFLGHSAMLINEGLPNMIVQKLNEKYSLKDKVVGILGMAYKGDSDDARESLSYKLKKILEIEAMTVLCTDPFIGDKDFHALGDVIVRSDVLILGAPHAQYRELPIDHAAKIIVDVWNYWGRGGLF